MKDNKCPLYRGNPCEEHDMWKAKYGKVIDCVNENPLMGNSYKSCPFYTSNQAIIKIFEKMGN